VFGNDSGSLGFPSERIQSLNWLANGFGAVAALRLRPKPNSLRSLRRGCPINQLLVDGVAKQACLHRYGATSLRVHFDSAREVDALFPLAVQQRWRVGLRCRVPAEHDRKSPASAGSSA
jgi:hypothetical protein